MDSSDNDGFLGPFGRHGFDFNTRIMVTAIVSFSIVIILVFVLHIYARYFLRRQPHRRSEIPTHQLSPDGGVNSGEPPKTGLDPLIIASLPIYVFKQSENPDYASSTTECLVCLSNLEDEEIARNLPNCNHTFHAVCIDKWLTSRSTCPICRAEAKPQLRPEPREAPAGGSSSSPISETERLILSSEIAGDYSNSDTQSPSSSKASGSTTSRLSSFRRMVSRERPSRRIHSSGQEDDAEDLERQRDPCVFS